MPAAEIIAIGTELLLGESLDTNTAFIARTLRDYGVDIFRTMIVGDNATRIAEAIRESLSRANIVITTGGLGPTVDDPTREAVAIATRSELIYHPELWDQIQERFRRYNRQPTENNRRQAYLPDGAVAIPNPVGTAPAFYYPLDEKVIVCLPGVPSEMETILMQSVIPYLRSRFDLREVIRAYTLHAAGVGESQVDEWLSDLEKQSNPTVGLLAHPGQVDIRITAKAPSIEEADQMIQKIVRQVYERMGFAIFGVNQQKLEQVVAEKLRQSNMEIFLVVSGFPDEVRKSLETIVSNTENLLFLPFTEHNLLLESYQQHPVFRQSQMALIATLKRGEQQQILDIFLRHPGGIEEITRSYGGPPPLAGIWAMRTLLEIIRRHLPLKPFGEDNL
ncbi:MAG: molybdopterin-binding protein [Bellilinea sp.]|nr:molybdopterin-binding protein [Bellilinea sp.]